jgi:acyl carrier protein
MSCHNAYEVVASALKCKPEDLNTNSSRYRTHGWDSFGHLAVILALEQACGLLIDDASVEKYTTMSAIVELLENQCYVDTQ